MDISIEQVKAKCDQMKRLLNERQFRIWAASEAEGLGRGGTTLIRRLTGMSRGRIARGHHELKQGSDGLQPGRIRLPGAGRKKIAEKDPSLVDDLDALIEPTTRGDPESPLRWTSKSTENLARELQAEGHEASASSIGRILHAQGYSLQAPAKQREGKQHPDRDAQFKHINTTTWDFQQRKQPVISVDTKKKELVGEHENAGREWHAKSSPPKVLVHDFPEKNVGKAIPYGVYDIARDEGWVNVGIDHDTAEFAAESIRRWWQQMGKNAYPKAQELYIVADAGGSNSPRTRLWRKCMQELADEFGLQITVSHFPPGTSKWNKIEHRLFSYITMNWRGRPLTSYEVIVNLIGHTKTRSGLRVKATLDRNSYERKTEVTHQEIRELRMVPCAFHGDWNYTFAPRTTPNRFD